MGALPSVSLNSRAVVRQCDSLPAASCVLAVVILAKLTKKAPKSEPPSSSSQTSSAMNPTVVAVGDATVLSQHAGSSSGPPPTFTMSWTGQSNAATGGAWGGDETASNELPPDYSIARTPTDVVEYTFSPHGFNSMLLLPPQHSPDTRPLYHISVSLNPFIPTAGVTTIHRGGSEDGKFVADFENMGSHGGAVNHHHRLYASGGPQCLAATWQGPKADFTWVWNNEYKRRLYWVSRNHIATCFASKRLEVPDPKKDQPLAVFSGRSINPPPADKRRRPLNTMKVYPNAHIGPLLDYILVGALMIERRRPSPWIDTRGLFQKLNFV